MAKQKKAQEVSAVRQAKHGWIITLLFAVLSILWISPIRFGRKNTVRKRFVPLIPFVSAIAIANDTILIISTETTVNSAVYQIE